MRTKRYNAPQHDLPGEAAQAFNLAGATTSDGWRDASDRNQSAEDRQTAARRQGDLFPDAKGYAPGTIITP